MDMESFVELISGRRRGMVAAFERAALRLLEWPMGLGVALRNGAWDRGWFRQKHTDIPVISVGNLTAGGTGKTPLVAWLIQWFCAHGIRPAILSRGYGAIEPGRPNDEAMELAMRFRNDGITEEILHLQNPDRCASVRDIESGTWGKIDRIVLDDGFQHRRLARDLEIVLLDATQPFGYHHLLPRGFLREPIRNLRRVGSGMVILTRADRIGDMERRKIRDLVLRCAPNVGWAELAQRPVSLVDSVGNHQPLAAFAGRPVVAICGIGNPRAFLDGTLQECGVLKMGERIFPDHHFWTDSERKSLIEWLREFPERPAGILCTGKDIVRWSGTMELDGVPLLAVHMNPVWLCGQEAMEQRLDALRRQMEIHQRHGSAHSDATPMRCPPGRVPEGPPEAR